MLAGHVNPDGDSLGSMLALTLALRSLGKDAVPLSHHSVPEIYRWLPGQEGIAPSTDRRDFDMAVVLDTGSLDRVGEGPRPAIASAASSLCIDHHVAEGRFGDLRLTNTRVAATGELVYRLLKVLGVPMNTDISNCLMCAIVTDTGGFRFANTTASAFRTAGALMRHGACPAAVSELVFERRSLASLKLLGRALDSLQVSEDGLIAWARITAEDYQNLGATDEDTEGIVSHVRAVRGTRVGVLFREVPGKKVRISLRGRGAVDLNAVAAQFGGGGHRLAAGCTHDPPLLAAETDVLSAVRRALQDAEEP